MMASQSGTSPTDTKADDHKFASEDLAKHYRKCRWWGRRTGFERVLVAISSMLFLVCIALIFVNVLLEARLRLAITPIGDTICSTKECIESASSILEKLDMSADPCDDFYQFACGSYLQRNTVPDDHYQRSMMQTMQEDIFVILKKIVEAPVTEKDSEAIIKVKHLYSSCMNISSVEDGSVAILLDLLTPNGVGEWPVLEKHWNKPDVELEWRLAMLLVHEVQPFIHTFFSFDEKNASAYLLHVYSGSPILKPQYYLNTSEPEHQLYLMAYRDIIIETMRLLAVDPHVAYRDVEDMIKFETDFANITEKNYESSGDNSNNSSEDDYQFNRINITQLEELVPEINWSLLVKHVLHQVGLPHVSIDLNLVLHCESYLHNLTQLVNNTSPRTVANYLTWSFVLKYMPYLDIHFRRLYYDFRRQVPNLSEERTFFARWKECVSVVTDGFGMALANLYVQQELDEPTKKYVEVMVKSIKETFISQLDQQDWMDNETKSLCKEKVEGMALKLGHPSYILDPEQLDNDYKGLDVTDDHFLNNIIRLNRFKVIRELRKITRPVDKERDWIVQPLVVNAFYETTGNAVLFPAGILRKPVVYYNRPKVLNYGTLGVIIGHEITHGFDNNGRKFDKAGNMTQWWPDEITEKFKEIITCFVDQYAQYSIDQTGQNVNGNHTLDENLCDYSGLQQSFMAYQNYVRVNGEDPKLPGIVFTNQQVFFLRYAQIWCEVLNREGYERISKDNHSPGRYRANGALLNSDNFAEAFNCPVGSAMNPEKKCRIWG